MISQVLFEHQFAGLDGFRFQVGIGLEDRAKIVEFEIVRCSEGLTVKKLDCRFWLRMIDQCQPWLKGAAEDATVIVASSGAEG